MAHPVLVKAVKRVSPHASRQRCQVHYADLRIMPILLTETHLEATLPLCMSA
jgi:hypothetical protein